MNETPKNKKTQFIIGSVAFLLAAVLLVVLLTRNHETEDPVAVIEEPEAPAYNLENTVRVINALLIAPDQLNSFDEYLRFMSQLDYTGVPEEVLSAREDLKPILRELSRLQEEYNDLGLWQQMWKQMGSGMLESLGPEDISLLIVNPGAGGLEIAKEAASRAFEGYEAGREMKAELLQEMDSVKEQYYGFLESFMPVYAEYIDEWNRLCLVRDRAYIALNNQQPLLVLEYCDSVLQNYPDNRETLLLKAMGLIQLSQWDKKGEPFQFVMKNNELSAPERDTLLGEAQKVVERYKKLYPSQSAPALLLEGLILEYRGDTVRAFTVFDQSSQEYPRQAQQLAGMLDSYRARTYLYKTVEGSKMINLYKSIMLGSGYFSPNFEKAVYYDKKDDLEQCAAAIYAHFVRRGNQDVYDGLLEDMVFCETFLPNSFNRLLPERNFIDLSFSEHKTGWWLFKENHNEIIDVRVDNQSNIEVSNLRIFLCIQYTDMIDYHVVKLKTIEWLPIRGFDTVNAVQIGYLGKTIDDIAKMRAIGMTDDKIFWIDNLYNAKTGRDYNEAHKVNYQKMLSKLESVDVQMRDAYFEAIKKNDTIFRKDIVDYSRVSLVVESKKKSFVEIDLPVELNLLSPTFTWELKLMPTERYLKGNYIHLVFEVHPTNGSNNTLYMTSDYLNYAIHINMSLDYASGPKLKVESVQIPTSIKGKTVN